MKVLVMGVNGFVGSVFVEDFCVCGYVVVVVMCVLF